eukprot:2353430-Ditylum_brightwellii.AAC.1
MEIQDGAGETAQSFSKIMLPCLLRVKLEHLSFNAWKALSKKDKGDWDTIQVTFLHETHKRFGADNDSSSKIRTANQKFEETNGCLKRKRTYM